MLAWSLLLVSAVTFAQNQEDMNIFKTSYDKSWAKVEQHINDDLPKSAIKETEKIYKKASDEGNFGQMARAGLTLMAMRGSISPDSMVIDVEQLEARIREREARATSPRDWAEVAMLHALAASVYHEWRYTSLTLSDEETLDVSNRRKAEHIKAATARASEIAGVSVADCRPLMEEVGKDSRFYHDDALSLVVDFFDDESFLNKEEEWRLYGLCATVYKEKGMREAYALMRMRELQSQNLLGSYRLRLHDDDYEEALKTLLDEMQDSEVGADVFRRWVNEKKQTTWQEELELAREAMRRWPESDIKDYFRRREMECLAPSLSVYVKPEDGSGTEIAGKPLMVKVSHRNVDEAELVVVRLRPKGKLTDLLLCNQKPEDMKEVETVWTQHLSFDAHKQHPELAEEMQYDTLALSLPAGCFRIYLRGSNLESKSDFQLSTLQVMTVSMPGGRRLATVVDAMSGAPKAGCEVIGLWGKYVNGKWLTFSKTYESDARGQVVLDPEIDRVAARGTADDETMLVDVNGEIQFRPSKAYEQTIYQAFTDRAIYRPGQTVKVSGFAYTRLGESIHAVEGVEFAITLRDANWQVIQKAMVKSDEFGAASTEFVLPTDRLTGRWHIEFGRTDIVFRVEEYKRPTFTLEMEETQGRFALGDTIEVTGVAKTYSGVPVQNAKVAFKVSMAKSTSWYRWYDRDEWQTAEEGETVTDDEGRFRVKVFLDDDMVRNSTDMGARVERVNGRYVLTDYYGMMKFRVEAKVTDLAGETHEDETTVRITARDFSLDVEGNDLVDRADTKKTEWRVKAVNAQGQKVDASGTWTLRKYNQQTSKYDIDVASGSFVADTPIELPSLQGAELGAYQLGAEATDTRGHRITSSTTFVLWDSKRGGRMNLAKDWIHASTRVLEPGKSVDVWYAVEKADAHTYLYIVDNRNVVVEKIAVLQPTQQHFRLEYKEDYGEGMRFYLAYVKDGRQHEIAETFYLVKPEKELKMAWTTFRDKLTPGQRETWTLRVVDKNGKPVPASVMATMYDASLDYFVRHAWPFSLYFSRYIPSVYSTLSHLGSVPSLSLPFRPEYPSVYSRAYNELRAFDDYSSRYGMERVVYSNMLGAAAGRPLDSRALMKMARVEEATAMMADAEETDEAMPTPGVAGGDDDEKAEPNAPAPQLRENFNETAFFEPNLRTDKEGNVSISFTLPDCLTEWRVLSLAHTAGIDYGHLEGTVVARKEFMVQPNMPRFVRQNDRLTIAAKIINTSENDLSGEALMRLINPENDAVVMTQKRPFQVGAGNTSSVTFDYDVPEEYPMLVCEISGTSGLFSDGERNFLPVLSSKRYVTETVPFYIDGAGTADIDLSSLFNRHSTTATQRRMTFEYTDNPSWQAILALHTVILPENDDMVSWSASLYANRVAQSIAKRMPRLLELIMRWNAEEGTETTLTSELEKNQELREILLQESPWMLDAQDETAQRHTLCELFDQRLLDRRIAAAKKKLAEKQFSDGGWSWFQGMEPSYYITLSVSEHMANLLRYLRSQDEEDRDVLAMLKKSLRYLDREELEYYNKYGKKDKRGLPTESTFRYLYLRTLVPEALKGSADIDAMKRFYLDKTQRRVADLSMYGRANVAVILYDDHRDAYARRFVQSLHEYTVTRPGMGRYFDTDKAQYSWCDYRIPTHLAAMQAFMTCLERESGADTPDQLSKDDLLQMQMWLLRQKQTQKWDNVLNTLAVADLLLRLDPETTFHEPQLPEVRFAGQPLEISGQTAAVGYSKTPVPDTLIDAATATVTKTTPSISWGCFYGQCLESLDRFQASGGELRVERKTYIETSPGEWQPLGEGTPLRVGDKVRIRNIVTSDRDMDFVQVRSQHAACLEPLRQTSGYQWLGGRGAYLAMHDASADLFFDCFRKGTSTLDLDYYVTRAGRYSLGISTVQCAYTPAFSGHSAGGNMEVGK